MIVFFLCLLLFLFFCWGWWWWGGAAIAIAIAILVSVAACWADICGPFGSPAWLGLPNRTTHPALKLCRCSILITEPVGPHQKQTCNMFGKHLQLQCHSK